MTFQPLTLADAPAFRALEKAAPPAGSDTAFTNLFIWRSHYRAMWAEAHGCACLIAAPEGEAPFGLAPTGPGDQVAAFDFTCEALRGLTGRPVFRRVPEGLAAAVTAGGRPFTMEPDRDNDDYIYPREQLATLAGRRMHQKKNHYNFFVSHNQFRCLPVTAAMAPDLLAVEENWLADKEGAEALAHEAESVRELLGHFDALGLSGLAIEIGGRIAGFTVGERVGEGDTLLVHVEKVDPGIRGLFTALSSHFCRDWPEGVLYVNREQDLGLPGLRLSKESLKPSAMRRKFTVQPS